MRITSFGLALIAGLFGATLAIAQEPGVREAIRFEKAKEAAARAQARKERRAPRRREPQEGVADAIRFERMKDAAAAAQARKEAGVEVAAGRRSRRAARQQRNR